MKHPAFDRGATPITFEEISQWRRWFEASPYAQTGIVEIMDLARSALGRMILPVGGELDMDAIYKNPKYAHLRRVS